MVIDAAADAASGASVPLEALFGPTPHPLQAKGLMAAGCASMGNPHLVLVFAKESIASSDQLMAFAREWGSSLEHSHLFPERVNVGFAVPTNPTALELVVWERGAGITQACGTGACAAAVCCLRLGVVCPAAEGARSEVSVSMPGGELVVRWDLASITSSVALAGPVEFDSEVLPFSIPACS